jgi:hypothetical protein
MDYSFYLLKLGTIPDQLHFKLAEYCKSLPCDVSTTMWNMQVHKGIDGVRFKPGETHPLLDEVLRLPFISEVFPTSSFMNYEVDKLAPNGHIAEHTDQRTIFENCVYTHRLHLAITGSARYKFRRGREAPAQPISMDTGGCYLFNNYVLHSVEGVGVDRYNFILNFSDPTWALKKSLYRLKRLDTTW